MSFELKAFRLITIQNSKLIIQNSYSFGFFHLRPNYDTLISKDERTRLLAQLPTKKVSKERCIARSAVNNRLPQRCASVRAAAFRSRAWSNCSPAAACSILKLSRQVRRCRRAEKAS